MKKNEDLLKTLLNLLLFKPTQTKARRFEIITGIELWICIVLFILLILNIDISIN